MYKSFIFTLFAGLLFIQAKAHVGLIYPTGGESFNAGEIVTVEWEELIAHNTLNWDLYFSTDGGNTWNPLEIDIPYETLDYQWNVPEITTTLARIKVVQDNDGTDYEDESTNFSISSVSSVNTILLESELKLYPNPGTHYITAEFDNPENSSLSLVIFDMTGRIIKTFDQIKTNKIIIARGDMRSGVYVFRLMKDNKQTLENKLFIQ